MVVKLLLDEGGSDLAAKDEAHGRTALHWGAGSGQESVIKLLLQKGADTSTPDGNSLTVLH